MSGSGRAGWDFDYRPIAARGGGGGTGDVVIATVARVSLERAREAFGAAGIAVAIEEILARPPLFWLRARGPGAADLALVERLVAAIGEVRYVAPAQAGTQRWAPRFELSPEALAAPSEWAARRATTAEERPDDGRWFLRAEGGGVAVSRAITGGGAGVRLAVIDDDAAGAEALDLDAEVLVGLEKRPCAQSHGAAMVGWAVGAARAEPPFRGVAPDASPRLYLVPKPGVEVVSLPLAIVRAAADGADVIVCATYVEGTWSAMLDDALAFAERAGRGGLGTIVVLPTGRETSSPPGSVHASLSLSFGDPAADPRVLCVAPGARRGGWFFYRDRRKLARPFGNRGPSVRALAPGDDLAHPLGGAPRLVHAESSGASAIAAGVVALVIAANPSLRMAEVLAVVERTVTSVDPAPDAAWEPFADRHDTRPVTRDLDGHNAKHGYGALSASRACLAASDPVAWALVLIGEDAAAARFVGLRSARPDVRDAYSVDLGRWLVRALLADAGASHAARALARHLRLLSVEGAARASSVPPGALERQCALLLRGLLDAPACSPVPREEITALLRRLDVSEGSLGSLGSRVAALAESLFAPEPLPGVGIGGVSA